MSGIQSVLNQNLALNAAGTGRINFIVGGSYKGYLSDTELDLSINVNTSNDKHYQIDSKDVLHNISTTVDKNVYLNARVIQNVSSTVSDGLFLNYINNSAVNHTNAHCRSAFRRGGLASQCKRNASQHHTTMHKIRVHKIYKT